MTSCGPVSVIIPTRNRSHLLIRAIESALSCGDICGEVIVVDDRSTDDTHAVVTAEPDPRVRYVLSDGVGGAAARNRGLREARFELIKFLDDDDYLLSKGLGEQVRRFEDVDLGSRDHVVIYGDALVTSQFILKAPMREVPAPRRFGESDVEYLSRVNVMTSCPLHQRHLLEQVGGFDESLPSYQENDLHLRLALSGVNFVSAPTDVYVFDNSSSRDRISNRARDRNVVEFRSSFLRHRSEMLKDHYAGAMPMTVRRALAQDFRECQRWARHAHFHDLDRLCAEQAIDLYPGRLFERLTAGWWVYGLVRRIRVKVAKRIRGVLPARLRGHT